MTSAIPSSAADAEARPSLQTLTGLQAEALSPIELRRIRLLEPHDASCTSVAQGKDGDPCSRLRESTLVTPV